MDHDRSQVTWYPLEVYPKTLATRTVLGRKSWSQFPLLRWNDDDKCETVSNEKGFQTFFKRSFWVVDGFQLMLDSSCHGFKLSWTSQQGYMVNWCSCCSVAIALWWSKMEPERPCLSIQSINLRAPMTHKRKTSSFPCIGVLGLVEKAWNLIGQVWNLVEWVQILVVANDRLAYRYFGVQHDCPRRGVKVWWEDVQCTEPPWTYLNIFKPILEPLMYIWIVRKTLWSW